MQCFYISRGNSQLWQPEAINERENRLSISQSAGPPVRGQHWPWLMWYFHSLLRLARWCSAQSRPASTPRMLSQQTENTPHGRDSDPSRSPDTTCNIVIIAAGPDAVKQPEQSRKPPVGYDLCGQASQFHGY